MQTFVHEIVNANKTLLFLNVIYSVIMQWSVLAVRNLCENNESNQKAIAELRCQGLSLSSEELMNSVGLDDLSSFTAN